MNSDEPTGAGDQGTSTPLTSDARQWDDAATLASLLDNELSATDRELALARLADEPELLTTFADAASALRMLEAESPPDATASVALRLTQSRRTRTFWIASAVAAGLAIATGLYSVNAIRRPPLGTPLQIIAMVERGPSSLAAYRWRSVRGPALIDSRAGQGVRTGVMIFELGAQLAANDSAAAMKALAIATQLDAIPAGSAAGAQFRRVAAATSATEAGNIFGAAANSVDPFYPDGEMRAGVWLGAARTAAFRHDTTFFNRAETAAALRLVEHNCKRVGCSSSALARLVNADVGASDKDWNVTQSEIEQIIESLSH